MKILPIPAGPIGTNAWLVINEEIHEAILFDAPPQSYSLIKSELEKQKCSLKALFITHGHWDHILDTSLFADDGVPVYAHIDSKEFLENPKSMSDYAVPGLSWKSAKITDYVNNGDIFSLSGINMDIRTAPGHCPGSIVIYMAELEKAITGDVIFDGSIGRTDLPGGSFELLKDEILNKIYTLPNRTVLCPGHGPATTVEKERNSNPFVRDEE